MRALIVVFGLVLALAAACASGEAGPTPTPAKATPGTSVVVTATPAPPLRTATPPPVVGTPPPAVATAASCSGVTCGITPGPTMICDPAACATATSVPGGMEGWIEGTVLVGPTCPVERLESPCPDRPLEADLTVLNAGGAVVARVRSDSDGRFRVALPAGDYVVRGEAGQSGLPSPGEPKPVTVRDGVTATVDLSYDSGIR